MSFDVVNVDTKSTVREDRSDEWLDSAFDGLNCRVVFFHAEFLADAFGNQGWIMVELFCKVSCNKLGLPARRRRRVLSFQLGVDKGVAGLLMGVSLCLFLGAVEVRVLWLCRDDRSILFKTESSVVKEPDAMLCGINRLAAFHMPGEAVW